MRDSEQMYPVVFTAAIIQNHTANTCPETVYTVLLDIAG